MLSPFAFSVLQRRRAKFGFYFFVSGTILFLLFLTLSHYFAAQLGYRSNYWELSELVFYGLKAKIFFMVALILESFSLLGVLLPLGLIFEGKKRRISYYSLVFLNCYLLLLVGAVSEDWFYLGHYILASLFFVIEGALILFTTICLFRRKDLAPRFYSFFGLATFLFFLFYIITRDLFYQAFTQRIAMLLPILYVLLLGIEFLLREHS